MVKLKKLFWTVLILTIFVNLMAAIPVYAANPAVSLGALTINAYGVGTATFSITSNGGCAITDCGIDYGTSPSNLNQCANLEAQPVGTHTVTLTGLSAGTIYYYRAYAVNANGGWVQSTVKSAVLPGSFDIKSPAKDSTVAYNSNVTVSWDTSKNASKYYLYMRDITAGDLNATEIYSGTSTSHKISSSELISGHKYKISVKAESSLSGNICQMWDTDSETGYYFYVANKPANPGSFSINSPKNNLCFMPDEAVTVSWGESSNAVQYVLSYADVTSGGSNVVLYTGSSLSYTISASKFNPGHKYKFILKARSVSGSDLYVANATNSGSCYIWRRPGYFEISEPENGETITTNSSVIVRWDNSDGASGYRLHIKDWSVSSSVTNIISVGTNTYYPIPVNTLIDGHTYKIHVEALSPSGIDDNSTWSTNSNEIYTFVYHANISKPGAFNIEFPDNNLAFMPDEDVVIRWTASKNAVEYKIAMRDITAGEKYPTEIYVGSETSYTIPESQLIDGHQYKIQVCARSVAGTDEGGTWATDADDYYFWVKPGYFHIEAPANNAIMTPEYNVVVKWTESLNASGYILNIRDLSVEGATTQKIDVGKETKCVFEPGSLVRGHKYKIHVQSWVNEIDDSYSTWSSNSDIMYSFVYGEASDAKVISVTVSPTSIVVGEKAKFTVRTNKETNKIIMYTESGAVADEWSGSAYYTDSGSERIWSFERIIYSVGKRFLTFKASNGTSVNDNSSATVSLNVEAAGGKITTTITSKKEYNTTIGGTYEASWSSDRSARSYNLLLYYNGNLIRTIKDYKYTYYKMGYAMFLTPGEYTLEVIPYYPGYEAIGDAATIYVSSGEVAAATIDSVDAPGEVVCNVDDFECTVVTSTGTNRVVLEPEVGMYLDFTLVSSGSKNKTWKFTKKINYIGKRKLTIRAFDNDGGEATPYQLNLNVIPDDIDWNIAYDEASGELTLSTSAALTSKLEGAYARLVVYKNGSSKNLMENSGELALINKASKKSRTWNVFTDLNLTAGETYTFAVSYLSTYAQGYGCGAIVETIGSKTLSDTEEELPEIYSVDIEIDEQAQTYSTDNVSLMSYTPEINYIQGQLGQTVTFTITTNKFVDKLYMLPDNGNIKDAVLLNGTYRENSNTRTWIVRHTFSGLHANRKFGFYGVSSTYGKRTFNKYADKIVTIGMHANTWSGSFSNNVLTVKQTGTHSQHYNDVNMYSLYIKNTETGEFAYYDCDDYSILTSSNLERKLERTWVIPAELPLVDGVTYEYGVRGGTNLYNKSFSSVDYKIGTFTTNHGNIATYYVPRTVTNCQELNVYAGGYWNNPIGKLYRNNKVFVDVANSNAEWARIKYNNGFAYIERKYLKVAEAKVLSQGGNNAWHYDMYGSDTMNNSACGVFALVNALSYLDGQSVDPISLAAYSIHIGARVPNVGTDRYKLVSNASGYKSFNCSECGHSLKYKYCTKKTKPRKYALEYNGRNQKFELNCSYDYIETSGSISNLITHLKNGGVAIFSAIVNKWYTDPKATSAGGHIMSVVDYCNDNGDEKFLILDSCQYHSNKYKNSEDMQYWVDREYLTNKYNSSKGFNLISSNRIDLFDAGNDECVAEIIELICYNDTGKEIYRTECSLSDNSSTINIPYSTSEIQVYTYKSYVNDEYNINYNGMILQDGDSFVFEDDSAEICIDMFLENENANSLYTINLLRSEPLEECMLKNVDVLLSSNKNQEENWNSIEINDNMEFTIPKSLDSLTLGLYSSEGSIVSLYENEDIVLETYNIPISDDGNTFTIIVENELGEEKEYTLTINKESEYESDTTLESIYVSAYDSADEYIDVYTFDSTVNEITGLSENAKTVMINASAASDFATVTYYIDGEETIFEKPISLSSGFVLTVRVTAEDGTYKDYTYTYGDPVVSLTKTTSKNTATYHKFYVTFEEPMDNATIYAAIYDKDGKLLGLETSPCDGDDYYIVNVPVNSNTTKAKIFVWADKNKPLGRAEIINMK